jgi:hypothetical protein
VLVGGAVAGSAADEAGAIGRRVPYNFWSFSA